MNIWLIYMNYFRCNTFKPCSLIPEWITLEILFFLVNQKIHWFQCSQILEKQDSYEPVFLLNSSKSILDSTWRSFTELKELEHWLNQHLTHWTAKYNYLLGWVSKFSEGIIEEIFLYPFWTKSYIQEMTWMQALCLLWMYRIIY